MISKFRQRLVLPLLACAISAGVTGTFAGPAQAAPVPPAGAATQGGGASTPVPMNASCGKTAPDLDNIPNHKAALATLHMFSGTSVVCDVKGSITPGENADYHCYTWATNGRTWTYLRNTHTNKAGWVADYGLKDGGSKFYCGF